MRILIILVISTMICACAPFHGLGGRPNDDNWHRETGVKK